MQGGKQNQRSNMQPRVSNYNRMGQKECQLGWNCKEILQNKCRFKHGQNDKEDIQALNRIRKKKIIIINDTSYKEIRPICLFEVFLPIKVIPNDKVKIEVGKYYVGYFVAVEDKCAIIEVEICLGSFGDWKIQRKIFQDHMPPIFYKCQPKENYRERKGKINVNGALQKVLTGEEGLRQYFHKVNEKGKYPLFEGCEVSYFEKNRNIEISRIKYPDYQKFSGILQIDGSSQFYFIARSENYDEMNPYRIPQEFCAQLKEFIHGMPYTLLKRKALKRQIRDKINMMLKDYLVKGEFIQWPLESRYPIISIQNEVQRRTFQSEKQGIIYETGIAIKSFSKEEKKESDKLLNKLKIQGYEKKRKLFNGKIFTVDSKNTKCHDDALEIQQIENEDYRVRIHIADIAEVIKSSSSLDRSMKERDATLYIRDYFQPMIHESLRNKLSLKQGDLKLAFTLSFKVSKDGQIDFGSVRFINSIIQVEKNLAYERLENKSEKYAELFQLNECLGKGDLLRQSSLIDYGSKSEFCMSRMIELSAIIPAVMLQLNVQRSKNFKQKFDQYLKRIIERKQKEMEEWENQVDKINKVRKQLNLTQNKEKKLKNQILKQIRKQRDRLIKQIKEEEKTKSQKEKKQKIKKQKKPKDMINGMISSSSQDSEIQTEVLNEQETLSIGVTEQNQIEDLIEDLNDVLIKEKEKRANALKQMKNKQNFVEISSSESQYSDDESEEDITLNKGYKVTKAMGGKKFLQKIFSHFKDIKLEWLRESQINEAFRKILSLDKGKLYQQYFKRLQITNRQHFPYIVQRARKQKRQNDRKNGKQEPQKQERRNRRNRRQENNIKNEDERKESKREVESKQNQKETQNKIENTKKNYQKKEYSLKSKDNNEQEVKPNITKKISEKQENREKHNQYDDKRQLEGIKNDLKGIQKNLSRLQDKARFSVIPPSMEPMKIMPQMAKNLNSMPIHLSMRGLPDCSKSSLLNPAFMSPQGMMPMFGGKVQSQVEENFKILPNKLPSLMEIRPQIKMPPSMKVPSQNKKFDLQLQKAKIPRQSKKKFEFSKEQNERLQQMINYLISHEEQVQKKYFSLLRNKEEMKPQFTEEEKKMMEESEQNFRVQYASLKKITIIRLYQVAEKKNKNAKSQEENKVTNQDKKSKRQREKGQKRKQEKLNENIGQKLQNEEKQLQKNQTNVQLSVEVNTSKKTQNKSSKDICQKMVQKNIQTKVQQEVQTKFKQNDEVKSSKNIETKQEKQALIEKKQVCENVQKDQQKQANPQISIAKSSLKKKSKKQIAKMVQQLMKPIAEKIKSKYTEQLQKLTEEINKLKSQESDAGRILKLELQKSNIHFNLIKLIAHNQSNKKDDESQNQSEKDDDDDQNVKGKKNKKKSKKNKKKQKKSLNVFEQILDNFYSYADKSNHDFTIMEDQELDEFLKKQLGFKEIYEEENYSLEKMNQEATKVAAENMTLKWNNPIRSYESLMVMRLIKQYDWLFQGNIFPTEIVRYGDNIKKIDKKLKKLKEYRQEKIANGRNDKKVKQANRQIDYLQFYYKLKKNPDRVYTFLNITSPTLKLKRVFHDILGDVDLENTEFVQELYKQVKGKVKIMEDFPIKLKIEIIQ